jgi:hypothetical protein
MISLQPRELKDGTTAIHWRATIWLDGRRVSIEGARGTALSLDAVPGLCEAWGLRWHWFGERVGSPRFRSREAA